ncbi:MAG: type restriction enzyme subunit, partial [Anaerophaga sp.]|nr:type restriction enzyme subunit [Anaerophaga sp.]
MQLFIVSNRVNTYYFANNNNTHFSFNADEQFLPIYQLASTDNKKITHLDDFSEMFLSKCTLGQMISRYMVLVASEQKLLIMRPYQIYAVKTIVDCIHQNRGNGYIWHTTGSGKTLTSFKASTLLKDNPDIEKCLFVVDRKDLDRQTREEFNKFQEGCVEENTNTEMLVRRLLSDNYANKVIVTTIQKLGLALDPNNKNNYKKRLEPLRNKRIVFIFDECHRSQFGENHKAIKEFFPNAQLFGFTGTPIFEDNAIYKQIDGTVGSYVTTRDIFQKQLHAYTITHAIEDRNVLRFHIDYFKPGKNITIGSTEHKTAVVNAIHFLSKEGTMAIILPHGVLFRGGSEKRIRTKLLKDGNIDTVIGLPAKLFYSTGIPVCILVLKKCKKFDDVLFINAVDYFEKGKRQNNLLPEHIEKIVAAYRDRKEETRYSRRVSMDEIEKNEFNLNISRYVSTS